MFIRYNITLREVMNWSIWEDKKDIYKEQSCIDKTLWNLYIGSDVRVKVYYLKLLSKAR